MQNKNMRLRIIHKFNKLMNMNKIIIKKQNKIKYQWMVTKILFLKLLILQTKALIKFIIFQIKKLKIFFKKKTVIRKSKDIIVILSQN